ncbi:hypothetical protein KR50_00800 [Jeotgalibacillus campisalis]|uniref:Uncharacterized protein n=1 Tax=Jeotgalibacillus campisalis TaxID=220754 RepID=A0A0C2W838_9BACL|nr:hypothetical protein KR50_00800 [Jeotgalibacillus campisalis]
MPLKKDLLDLEVPSIVSRNLLPRSSNAAQKKKALTNKNVIREGFLISLLRYVTVLFGLFTLR